MSTTKSIDSTFTVKGVPQQIASLVVLAVVVGFIVWILIRWTRRHQRHTPAD